MTREQAHDLMENELRCVQRGNYCDRDCAKCPLVKDDKELIEAYGYVIKALEQQSCEKCEQPDENDELLSPDERADVLNAIIDMLEEKGFDLEVCGYEDNDGVFFDVMLMRR